jgi:ABC-type polysaccharide/polyol phosphate export permease
MQNFLIIIGSAFAAVLGILLIILIGPLVGAFTGAMFGYFFPQTAIAILTALGLQSIAFWQFGAALGFISGFFRNVRK